jgi:hypothetical protein
MKFLTRFVIPNLSAQKIGVDLVKGYTCDVVSHKPPQNFVVIASEQIEKPILMEVSEFDFLEDRVVLRGWLNYNYTSESYLCKGSVELRVALNNIAESEIL